MLIEASRVISMKKKENEEKDYISNSKFKNNIETLSKLNILLDNKH